MKITNFVILTLLLVATPQPTKAQVPYEAWVNQEDIYTPEALLRFGDRVRVVHHSNGWAMLYPQGRVRISHIIRDSSIQNRDTPENMRWARVTREFSFQEEIISRGDEIIFRQGMPIEYLRMYEPSRFIGWQNPPNNFAFALRNSIKTHEDGTWETVSRYDRFQVYDENRDYVTVREGEIPRRDVRVGSLTERPRTVPRGVRWAHVDLAEQVLTVYDEQDALVYATLVSSGRRPGSTRRGTFQVRRKILYTTMRGGGRHPYKVEGVPWVLYFDGAIAFHGNYWHDQHGFVRSHGCVNLSPGDARWLFNFAPGDIPDGWRSVHPVQFSGNTLYVVIE